MKPGTQMPLWTIGAPVLAMAILAARLALQEGIGFNLGGGFHHAFSGHGEGFCAINDIAVAIHAAVFANDRVALSGAAN